MEAAASAAVTMAAAKPVVPQSGVKWNAPAKFRTAARPLTARPTVLAPVRAAHSFAVVEVGSHQYRVSQDDVIYTEKLVGVAPGDKVELGRVLLLGGGDKLAVGTPYVENAVVRVQMLRMARDRKKVFNVRPKEMSVLKVLELDGPEGIVVNP